MKGIADLHIHSRYSRATSKDGTPEQLDLWARKKGITLVGTGDFTHPAWRKELEECLVPAEEGLYKLKRDFVLEETEKYTGREPRFVVSGEISSIYKKNGKVRKVHNVILLPGLEEAKKLSKKLEAIGNIHSDGRPILGLDCRDLLEIMLDVCPEGILIPAHIWTPHFSLFGAFSGFDSIEECFEDLTPFVHALETGLSSDPPMNWRWSALDRYQLISNSDAHSPGKLGREANLLDTELSYKGLSDAVQYGKGLLGTVEFFPEEGKYHYDGHRKCHLCLSPREAEKYGGKCPVCGKKLTVGVDHRIVQLADRGDGFQKQNGLPYESLVPLLEVLGASLGYSPASKRVQEQYEKMLQKLGTEFEILREVPIEDIRVSGYERAAEGIRRLRAGQVERKPGFDGEYGTICLFRPEELENLDGQMSFFQETFIKQIEKEQKENVSISTSDAMEEVRKEEKIGGTETLNVLQKQAVEAVERAVMVIAGPGTGKTKTLVERIRYLLETRKVKPSEITAVTFTNQAASELQERIQGKLTNRKTIRNLKIGTFHSICMEVLKKLGKKVYLAQESELLSIGETICGKYGLSMQKRAFLTAVSAWKTGNTKICKEEDEQKLQDAFLEYEIVLKEKEKWDFDDLLLEMKSIFMQYHENEEKIIHPLEKGFSYVLVDEFQDISPLQYQLIMEWNKRGKELFVIGDPDQSIYGFRGADAKCFWHIREAFPQIKTITLKENYRSTEKILMGASGVISHNPGDERVWNPCRKDGIPIRIVQAESRISEAIFVAKEITRLIGGIDMIDIERQERKNESWKNRTFGDIAILYRTHSQARLLEKCLSQEGIPYMVYGREDFLEEDLIRGTVNFFSSLMYPDNHSYKEEAKKFLWNFQDGELTDCIYENLAQKYEEKWQKQKPAKLLKEWAKDLGKEEETHFKKFLGMAVLYDKLPEFFNNILLGEEGDLKRSSGKTYSPDVVSLMTVHGSKGLEFPVVFLFGVEEGEFPLERERYETQIEEERRLFFVGMTRAKEELILSYSGNPSVFLEELPQKCVEKEQANRRKPKENMKQMSLFDFM